VPALACDLTSPRHAGVLSDLLDGRAAVGASSTSRFSRKRDGVAQLELVDHNM
jgi:hypothetical protein